MSPVHLCLSFGNIPVHWYSAKCGAWHLHYGFHFSKRMLLNILKDPPAPTYLTLIFPPCFRISWGSIAFSKCVIELNGLALRSQPFVTDKKGCFASILCPLTQTNLRNFFSPFILLVSLRWKSKGENHHTDQDNSEEGQEQVTVNCPFLIMDATKNNNRLARPPPGIRI